MDSFSNDFFAHIPSTEEKDEMRRATKPPSEWLSLLCKDWAIENSALVETIDLKFLSYKSYLKGKLSSQLLCRISIPEIRPENEEEDKSGIEFWKIMGVQDEFDISFIISQVEKFCVVYGIRCYNEATMTSGFEDLQGMNNLEEVVDDLQLAQLHNFLGNSLDVNMKPSPVKRIEPRKLLTSPGKESKENEENVIAAEAKEGRELTREEKRNMKLLGRKQREERLQREKDEAIDRAVDLLRSNRIPISITKGVKVVKKVQKMINETLKDDNALSSLKRDTSTCDEKKNGKKTKAAITISTAADLDKIVTLAQNLYDKYNAIARVHKQKVSWAMISEEIGINVKVREKYARMHNRAVERGFDFKANGHFKLKDHPQIFKEPLPKKRKRKETSKPEHIPMPPIEQEFVEESQVIIQNVPEPDNELYLSHTNDLDDANVSLNANSVENDDHGLEMYDQVAAAVDSAFKSVPVEKNAADEVAEAALTAHLSEV